MCLGRGKVVICGGEIRFSPFFTLGSYFCGTKMVLISAEPFFRFVQFYAWFLFSREQNGSYFRAHIKNAKIWTREVLKRENEVRAKKWTFTVIKLSARGADFTGPHFTGGHYRGANSNGRWFYGLVFSQFLVRMSFWASWCYGWCEQLALPKTGPEKPIPGDFSCIFLLSH